MNDLVKTNYQRKQSNDIKNANYLPEIPWHCLMVTLDLCLLEKLKV